MNVLWKTQELENINRIKGLIEEMYKNASKTSPIKVGCHLDADGITSAVLFAEAYPHFLDIECLKFNHYIEKDIVFDLGKPATVDYKGIVIDHHDHPQWKEGSYNLIWDDVPATLMVYNLFKDKIPDSAKWKIVVGLYGDGRPELIPNEIWDMYPQLFERMGSIMGEYYGKLKVWSPPLYTTLSAPINAVSKMGSPFDAFRVLKEANNPLDIVLHPATVDARRKLNKIINEATRPDKDLKIFEFNKLPVLFCWINEKAAIGANIAMKLKKYAPNKTIILVNNETKDGSIRGDLAYYIATKLSDRGIQAGGHPGFCGVTLIEKQSASDVLSALWSIMS